MEVIVHLAETDVIPVRTRRPVLPVSQGNTSIQVISVYFASPPVLYAQPKILVAHVQAAII